MIIPVCTAITLVNKVAFKITREEVSDQITHLLLKLSMTIQLTRLVLIQTILRLSKFSSSQIMNYIGLLPLLKYLNLNLKMKKRRFGGSNNNKSQ